MNASRQFKSLLPIIVIFFMMGLLIWLFRNIFTYILISLIVAAILKNPVDYITRLNFFNVSSPKSLAVIVCYLFMIGVFGLFISLFVPLISDQINFLSAVDYTIVFEEISSPLTQMENFFIKTLGRKIDIQSGFKEGLVESVASFTQSYLSTLFNNVISITSNFFIGFLAVTFITFFMLYEKGIIKKYFISLIPNRYFEVSIATVSKTQILLRSYLFGLLVQMMTIFSVVSFGMLIIGMENYAIIVGLFAALANLIPFLGPVLGCLFGLFVGLSTATTDISIWNNVVVLVAKILSVFTVVQLTDNILLQPLIFSRSVKAHPLEIFLIVFVGANLADAVGMILAIPTYTVLKVGYTEFYKGYKQYRSFGG